MLKNRITISPSVPDGVLLRRKKIPLREVIADCIRDFEIGVCAHFDGSELNVTQ
jgi:hypothetical protein